MPARGRAKPATTLSTDELSAGGLMPPAARSSDQFVITESTHLCGYPNCGKRFRFKHDLLRHQTKFHGREPVRPRKSAGTGADLSGMTSNPVTYFDDDDDDYFT